jgi:hypothetical protein
MEDSDEEISDIHDSESSDDEEEERWGGVESELGTASGSGPVINVSSTVCES